jgi:hypothetical protein
MKYAEFFIAKPNLESFADSGDEIGAEKESAREPDGAIRETATSDRMPRIWASVREFVGLPALCRRRARVPGKSFEERR